MCGIVGDVYANISGNVLPLVRTLSALEVTVGYECWERVTCMQIVRFLTVEVWYGTLREECDDLTKAKHILERCPCRE